MTAIDASTVSLAEVIGLVLNRSNAAKILVLKVEPPVMTLVIVPSDESEYTCSCMS